VNAVGNWGYVDAGAIVANEVAGAPGVGNGRGGWRAGKGIAVVVGVIRF
jgi:hypothetical protein